MGKLARLVSPESPLFGPFCCVLPWPLLCGCLPLLSSSAPGASPAGPGPCAPELSDLLCDPGSKESHERNSPGRTAFTLCFFIHANLEEIHVGFHHLPAKGRGSEELSPAEVLILDFSL